MITVLTTTHTFFFLPQYDYVTKAISGMRFVHWCRVPWIIGADVNKGPVVDMEGINVENIINFDPKAMTQLLTFSQEEANRWQSVSWEMFLAGYKNYIKQCVSLTSINVVSGLRLSRRNSIVGQKEKLQRQMTPTQKQIQGPQQLKIVKALRQRPASPTIPLMQPETSQSPKLPGKKTTVNSGSSGSNRTNAINEYFFKKSDNSVIMFKISFVDGYCNNNNMPKPTITHYFILF